MLISSFFLACSEANADQPFMCLDLTFIWVLLEKGFGLGPETPLHVSITSTFLRMKTLMLCIFLQLYKKVNGHEISWALGAAYNVLKK